LGYKNLFLLASIPSIVGAVLIIVFIKDRKTKGIYKGLSLKDLTFNLKLFLLLSALFALGSFSYSFLLVYAEAVGFATGFIPVLYLVFTAVASLVSLPFGKLADRLGRKTVLILAYIFWGLVCLGFIYTTSLVGVTFLFVVYGLHKGAIEPVQKAFVSELSPIDYRASMLGTFQMVVGLCALPASLIAGSLWISLGRLAPFYFSLSLTTPAIVLMLFVREKRT
jgi:MFS family permease